MKLPQNTASSHPKTLAKSAKLRIKIKNNLHQHHAHTCAHNRSSSHHTPHQISRQNQPTTSKNTDTRNESSYTEASKFLAKLLDDSDLKYADGPKAINTALKNVYKQLSENKASSGYRNELNKIKAQLIKETQQIHIESMLLKLTKKAATKTNSISEAIELVKNCPGIKNQSYALKELERISKEIIHLKNFHSMDISQLLHALQCSKPKYISSLIDTQTIRNNSIKSSLFSNRIDKENTGLKNTILIDQNNSLIALKNSVDIYDPMEDPELIKNLLNKTNENFDRNNHKIISDKKSHMHDQKNGHIKVILGQGTYGKVRLAMDMLTGEHIAVKKMRSIKHAKREILEIEKLAQALRNNPFDLQFFLTAENIAISHGKDGKIRAYVTSKLQNGDDLESLNKLHSSKSKISQSEFEKAHGLFILKTMNTLQVLNRNNMVHGDLKWPNMIGGKIGDIDGICYKFGELISTATKRYVPPELFIEIQGDKRGITHPSKESYDKHTSFTFGIMLLESIDPDSKRKFPLKRISPDNSRPIHGYSRNTPIPEYNSFGQKFTDYERKIIRLAYALADTKPENRPTIEEAIQKWQRSIS